MRHSDLFSAGNQMRFKRKTGVETWHGVAGKCSVCACQPKQLPMHSLISKGAVYFDLHSRAAWSTKQQGPSCRIEGQALLQGQKVKPATSNFCQWPHSERHHKRMHRHAWCTSALSSVQPGAGSRCPKDTAMDSGKAPQNPLSGGMSAARIQ